VLIYVQLLFRIDDVDGAIKFDLIGNDGQAIMDR